MTMEEFDREVTEIGDWFISGMKKLHEEYAAKCDVVVKKGEGLPEHLVGASLAKLMKRLNELGEEMESQ
jgi:hypothetical protein